MREHERLAELVALSPEDFALRRVYADALEEADLTNRAEEARRVADFLEGPALSKKQETEVRRRARAVFCPVEIVPGDSPPREEGEEGHSVFKNGGICNNPGGAMRAGYKVRYVRSTRKVTVGLLWLIAEYGGR